MVTVKDTEVRAVGTSANRVGNTIHELRTGKGLSVRTLAARAGFSPSFISQVEHGLASPSIASLEKLAATLGVTLSEFFAGESVAPDSSSTTIVRAADRFEITSEWSRARLEALGSTGSGHALEPLMLTLEHGGQSGNRAAHNGHEFAIVWEGAVRLVLGNTAHRLAPGDSVTFRSTTPNRWENTGAEQARVLIVTARLSLD